jgi:hypothetical protein
MPLTMSSGPPPFQVNQDLCVYCLDCIYSQLKNLPEPPFPNGFPPQYATPLFCTLTVMENYNLPDETNSGNNRGANKGNLRGCQGEGNYIKSLLMLLIRIAS